jgi:hypothetical protein
LEKYLGMMTAIGKRKIGGVKAHVGTGFILKNRIAIEIKRNEECQTGKPRADLHLLQRGSFVAGYHIDNRNHFQDWASFS